MLSPMIPRYVFNFHVINLVILVKYIAITSLVKLQLYDSCYCLLSCFHLPIISIHCKCIFIFFSILMQWFILHQQGGIPWDKGIKDSSFHQAIILGHQSINNSSWGKIQILAQFMKTSSPPPAISSKTGGLWRRKQVTISVPSVFLYLCNSSVYIQWLGSSFRKQISKFYGYLSNFDSCQTIFQTCLNLTATAGGIAKLYWEEREKRKERQYINYLGNEAIWIFSRSSIDSKNSPFVST